MSDIYKCKYKLYPDGTYQYWVYDRYIERDSNNLPWPKKVSNITNIERKENDNQKRARVEVYDICRSNKFFWFFTLTFDDSINSYEYRECVCQLKRFTKWLGKQGCKYIFVPEQHKSGRWHFHGLVTQFEIKGRLHLRQAYNAKTGKPILGIWNIENYKFGYNTCSVIKYPDRVATYLSKYLTKDMSVPKGEKRYWCSSGLERPMTAILLNDIDEHELMLNADFSKSVRSDYGGYRLYEFHKSKI